MFSLPFTIGNNTLILCLLLSLLTSATLTEAFGPNVKVTLRYLSVRSSLEVSEMHSMMENSHIAILDSLSSMNGRPLLKLQLNHLVTGFITMKAYITKENPTFVIRTETSQTNFARNGTNVLAEFENQGSYQLDMSLSQNLNFTLHIHENVNVSLNIQYKCETDLYGQFCDKFCRPGRTYECSNDGNPICFLGWTGPQCLTALCSCPGRDQNRSYCNEPNQCSCFPGWSGVDCSQCVRGSLCAHGFCTRPFGCVCYPGWTGIHCNIGGNVQSSNCSCLNGGLCEHFQNDRGLIQSGCICPAYFSGSRCEVAVRRHAGATLSTTNMQCRQSHCLNGGECFTNGQRAVCICNRKWSGKRCEIALKPCAVNQCLNNGTCHIHFSNSSGFVCDCPVDFHGQLCEFKRSSFRLTAQNAFKSNHYINRPYFLILGVAVSIIVTCFAILFILGLACMTYPALTDIVPKRSGEHAPPPYEECTLNLLTGMRPTTPPLYKNDV